LGEPLVERARRLRAAARDQHRDHERVADHGASPISCCCSLVSSWLDASYAAIAAWRSSTARRLAAASPAASSSAARASWISPATVYRLATKKLARGL